MSLNAYQRTQRTTETSSQTEYRLFAEITRELIEVKDLSTLDSRLHEALYRNRQLWSTLALDCSLPENPLPDTLRAGIISLAIFVDKHISKVARGQDSMDVLIEINRSIMEGLAMQAKPVLPAAAPLGNAPAGAPSPPLPGKIISA